MKKETFVSIDAGISIQPGTSEQDPSWSMAMSFGFGARMHTVLGGGLTMWSTVVRGPVNPT